MSEETARDLAALGAPADAVERARTQSRFAVWPENAEAVEVFVACATQWRHGPTGAPVGLDYAGVRAAIALMGKRADAALFAKIRTMEAEAMGILAAEARGSLP